MDITAAAAFLNSVDNVKLDYYTKYWTAITPTDNKEKFKRWLFAYASVHTTWKSNVSLYNHLKDCEWLGNSNELKQRIEDSGAGLYNNRTRFIMQFSERFWNDPTVFDRASDEPWLTYRNRMDELILGLGRAKIAFAQEMIDPLNVQLLCTDVHILKLHGYTNAMINRHIKDKEFDVIEQHWVEACVRNKIPSALARFIYWDTKQKKLNSRYWSYLFETENIKETLNEIEETYMELSKVKEEFVNNISARFVNPVLFAEQINKTEVINIVKVAKDKDLPDTVGGLINWFLTCDGKELKEVTVAKWSVVRSGLRNFELQCRNHQFSGNWNTILVRPTDIYGVIIGNRDVLRDRKHYGIDNTITNEMLKRVSYMLSLSGMKQTSDTTDFVIEQVSGNNLRFSVNDIGFLFVRYDATTPNGCAFKLSSNKITIAKAEKEVWEFANKAITGINNVCYLIPADDPILISNEAEDYHYDEILGIVDDAARLKIITCLYNFINRPEYANDPVYKARCDDYVVKHNIKKKELEGNSDVGRKMNSLKCMTDETYGSCRFTKIIPKYTINLIDGLGETYVVKATAARIIDKGFTDRCCDPHGYKKGDEGKIIVRGCVTIEKNNESNYTFPLLTDGWTQLIIPSGIKIEETKTTEGN